MRPGRLILTLVTLVTLGHLSSAHGADPPKKAKESEKKAEKSGEKKTEKSGEKKTEKPTPRAEDAEDEEKSSERKKAKPSKGDGAALTVDVDEKSRAGAAREGTRYGAGLQLGAVMAKGATGGYRLISPDITLSGVADGVLSGAFSWRLEPTFSTFTRASSRVALVSVDAASATPVITQETISNRTRVYELYPRALVGFDVTETVTARAGVLVGLSFGSTATSVAELNSEACRPVPLGSSLVYGATLVPATLRLGEKRNIEIGVVAEWSKRTVPICDRPLPEDGLRVLSGQRVEVVGKVVTRDVSAIKVGLQASLLAW